MTKVMKDCDKHGYVEHTYEKCVCKCKICQGIKLIDIDSLDKEETEGDN